MELNTILQKLQNQIFMPHASIHICTVDVMSTDWLTVINILRNLN